MAQFDRDISTTDHNELARQLCVAQRLRASHKRRTGKADWNWLTKIKKAVSIPLMGNGDVAAPEDAKAMLETGCDGVMIGRGAITNPWIFMQTKYFLKTGSHLPPPAIEERVRVCLEHLNLSVKYKGPWRGVMDLRKHYAGYFNGLPHVAQLRSELMQLTDSAAVISKLSALAESRVALQSA